MHWCAITITYVSNDIKLWSIISWTDTVSGAGSIIITTITTITTTTITITTITRVLSRNYFLGWSWLSIMWSCYMLYQYSIDINKKRIVIIIYFDAFVFFNNFFFQYFISFWGGRYCVWGRSFSPPLDKTLITTIITITSYRCLTSMGVLYLL